MAQVARTYPDPHFIEEDGRVRADTLEIRTEFGDVVTGELVRRTVMFPTKETFDATLTQLGYQRQGDWRREGEGWVCDVTLVLLTPQQPGDSE